MRDVRLDDLAAILTIAIAVLTGVVLLVFSLPSIPYVHLSIIWDPVSRFFGILAFVFGTLYVSLLALLISSPIGIGAALYIVRYAPDKVKRYYSMIVEAMASVPSVVYGLRGFLVLGSFFGAFKANKLVASLTLSVMLLPTIISLSRASLESVPREIVEAAYALGAMKHEAALVALGYSRNQILGSVLIALMRAVGETMAVTMTVGNVVGVSMNPLDPGSTLTSLIATEFGGAMDPIHRSAIIFAAFLLFVISLTIYSIARRVIGRGEEK